MNRQIHANTASLHDTNRTQQLWHPSKAPSPTPCSPGTGCRTQHMQWVLQGINCPVQAPLPHTNSPFPTCPVNPVIQDWILAQYYQLFALGRQGSCRMGHLPLPAGSATGLVLIEWGHISDPPCHTRIHQCPFLELALIQLTADDIFCLFLLPSTEICIKCFSLQTLMIQHCISACCGRTAWSPAIPSKALLCFVISGEIQSYFTWRVSYQDKGVSTQTQQPPLQGRSALRSEPQPESQLQN